MSNIVEYKDIPKYIKMYGNAISVGDLGNKLKNIREDVPVVVPGEDHSFVPVGYAYGYLAAYDKKTKRLSERDDVNGLGEHEEAVFVFVVSIG